MPHPCAGITEKFVKRDGVGPDVVAAHPLCAGEGGQLRHQLQAAALGFFICAPDRDPDLTAIPRRGNKAAERGDPLILQAKGKVEQLRVRVAVLIVIGKIVRQVDQRMPGTPVKIHKFDNGSAIGSLLSPAVLLR